MARHFIAWNPEERIAYRGATEAEAKGQVMVLTGMKGSWTRCKANGWRVSMIEEPEPVPATPARTVRSAARRPGRRRWGGMP